MKVTIRVWLVRRIWLGGSEYSFLGAVNPNVYFWGCRKSEYSFSGAANPDIHFGGQQLRIFISVGSEIRIFMFRVAGIRILIFGSKLFGVWDCDANSMYSRRGRCQEF